MAELSWEEIAAIATGIGFVSVRFGSVRFGYLWYCRFGYCGSVGLLVVRSLAVRVEWCAGLANRTAPTTRARVRRPLRHRGGWSLAPPPSKSNVWLLFT